MITAERSALLEPAVMPQEAFEQATYDIDWENSVLCAGSGGMAGINALATCYAIYKAGHLNKLKAFYGLSAGGFDVALCAAQLMEDETDGKYAGGKVFEAGVESFQELAAKGFMSWMHFFKGRYANMAVFEDVLSNQKALNTELLAGCSVPVKIGVTQITGGIKPLTVDLTKIDPAEVIPNLKYGSHVPILFGPAPDDKGIRKIDGASSHRHVIDLAAEDGWDKIVFASCQPYSDEKFKPLEVAASAMWMWYYDSSALREHPKHVRDQVDSRAPLQEGKFMWENSEVWGLYPPKIESKKEVLATMRTKDKRILSESFERVLSFMEEKVVPRLLPAPEFLAA